MPLKAQGTASVSNKLLAATLNHRDYFYASLQQLVNKMQFTGALAETINIDLSTNISMATLSMLLLCGEDWLRVCY